MTESTRAYPLHWPAGWPRAEYRKRARFGDRSVARARKELENEVRRFGGEGLIVSTNLELRSSDGLPRSNQRQPSDPGVAIYFKWNGQEKSMAIDVYTTVEDNLWAHARTFESLRRIDRDGGPTIIDRAFRGFAQLPDPDTKPWWEVLRVHENSIEADVRIAYRNMVRRFHTDGAEPNIELFLQVQKAWETYNETK